MGAEQLPVSGRRLRMVVHKHDMGCIEHFGRSAGTRRVRERYGTMEMPDNDVVEFVGLNGFATMEDIARRFSVSKTTVRHRFQRRARWSGIFLRVFMANSIRLASHRHPRYPGAAVRQMPGTRGMYRAVCTYPAISNRIEETSARPISPVNPDLLIAAAMLQPADGSICRRIAIETRADRTRSPCNIPSLRSGSSQSRST